MFFGTLNHRATAYTVILSHINFQNRGLNLLVQNCRHMLTRQRQLEDMEEAGSCKEEQIGKGLHSLNGAVWEPLMWCFCLVLWVLGRLAIEDELTCTRILPLLLWEFEMKMRAAQVLGMVVVANNIIIILVWKCPGYSQSWNATVWDCIRSSTNRSRPCSKL